MKNFLKITINIFTIGIPFLIGFIKDAIKITRSIIKKLDFDKNGKISKKEIIDFIKNGKIDIQLKNK